METEEMWYWTIRPELDTIFNIALTRKEALKVLKRIVAWLEEREAEE